MKAAGEPIAMLTCYDYSTAKLMNTTAVDSLLVGDSLGTVMLGYPDTLSVTMEDMIRHTQAVVRGAPDKFVVADMPFMSYQTGVRDAVINAGRLVKDGHAQAVKLEGGSDYAEEIAAIVRAGIPVMGHLGLTPQSVNALGGYRVQAKTEEAVKRLVDDALALEEAGVFAVVIECTPASAARAVTEALRVPTIGIGAGAACDGQILVWQDMAGLFTDFAPKFVKRWADTATVLKDAFNGYVSEVKTNTFPGPEHTFGAAQKTMKTLYGPEDGPKTN